MSALLEVENLDLYYGDVQALAGVSIEVPKSEIVAIVGANGAGKTSLIRAIAGIERPAAGTIYFNGRNITGLDSHEVCDLGICQVAEGRQLFASLTTLENLTTGALHGRARGKLRQSLDEVFALFPKLRERRGQIAGTLSGGEQQMLAIARALVARPKLLLLDEPSLGLAPNVARDMLRAIGALNEKGTTILLVEQNVALSLKLARHGYVLENGRVVMSGSGVELLHDPRIRQAYLGL